MTAWFFTLLSPPQQRRFRRVERDCRWYGSHRDVRWTPMLHGRVLVGQCWACREVVGAVVQRVSEDFPGAIE